MIKTQEELKSFISSKPNQLTRESIELKGVSQLILTRTFYQGRQKVYLVAVKDKNFETDTKQKMLDELIPYLRKKGWKEVEDQKEVAELNLEENTPDIPYAKTFNTPIDFKEVYAFVKSHQDLNFSAKVKVTQYLDSGNIVRSTYRILWWDLCRMRGSRRGVVIGDWTYSRTKKLILKVTNLPLSEDEIVEREWKAIEKINKYIERKHKNITVTSIFENLPRTKEQWIKEGKKSREDYDLPSTFGDKVIGEARIRSIFKNVSNFKSYLEGIDNKISSHAFAKKGYEYGLEYNADTGLCNLSEEFVGKGNGYYYLSFDGLNFLFIERD